MNKRIEILLLLDADEFLDQLNDKAKEKFSKAFDKTEAGFYGEHFKKMPGTDDLWEFSVNADRKFYRVLSFWDSRDKDKTYIVCTHGFEKKSNKTPKNEINKAEQLKRRYFEY